MHESALLVSTLRDSISGILHYAHICHDTLLHELGMPYIVALEKRRIGDT